MIICIAGLSLIFLLICLYVFSIFAGKKQPIIMKRNGKFIIGK